MKFKSYSKLALTTLMVSLLASIPIPVNAYTAYKNIYTAQKINFSNTIVVNPSNNQYTIVEDQEQTTNNYENYYVVSRGDYSRTLNNLNPIERPVENVQPEPWEPQPVAQPIPQSQPKPELQARPEALPQDSTNTDFNLAGTSNGIHSLSSEEIQMVDYVNKERQDAGLEPLEIDVDLAYVARIKSEDMYNNNYFSHDSPTYGSPFDMMTQFGIKYRGAAENIAKNVSLYSAHNSLMRSQGHKNNILNPIYTHIGIGISNGYYTQMFIRK